MQLEIPDNTTLHIIIGKPAPVALPDMDYSATASTVSPPPASSGRHLLTAVLGAALLLGGYGMGRILPHTSGVSTQAAASIARGAADDRGAPPDQGATVAAPQIPDALTRQLQQQPTIVPAPNQPPATSNGQSPRIGIP